MYKNTLKEKIRVGKKMATVCLLKDSEALAEIAGKAGFDGIVFDAEHSTLSQKDCENLCRACEAVGTIPVIRTRKNEPELILRYLDAGAMGILIPNIRTPEDAEAAVQAVKYAPRGNRGLSTTRASDYGLGMPMKEYVAYANEQTLVWIMVENIDCIDNLKEILEVDGIDGFMIGTTDLSQSMGFPGNPGAPEVKEAVQKALDIGLASGKTVGSMLRPGESAKQYFDDGYRMLTADGIGFFRAGVLNFLRSVNE